MSSFSIKEGNLLPEVTFQLLDENDVGVDLSLATDLVWKMRHKQRPSLIVQGDASIVTTASGEGKYTWADGDTEVAGDYDAEVVVTWTGGKTETFPSDGYALIVVTDAI